MHGTQKFSYSRLCLMSCGFLKGKKNIKNLIILTGYCRFWMLAHTMQYRKLNKVLRRTENKNTQGGIYMSPKMIARTDVEQIIKGLKPKTLANLNSLGKGPNFYKIGHKAYYDVDDLMAWAKAHKIKTNEGMD